MATTKRSSPSAGSARDRRKTSGLALVLLMPNRERTALLLSPKRQLTIQSSHTVIGGIILLEDDLAASVIDRPGLERFEKALTEKKRSFDVGNAGHDILYLAVANFECSDDERWRRHS